MKSHSAAAPQKPLLPSRNLIPFREQTGAKWEADGRLLTGIVQFGRFPGQTRRTRSGKIVPALLTVPVPRIQLANTSVDKKRIVDSASGAFEKKRSDSSSLL